MDNNTQYKPIYLPLEKLRRIVGYTYKLKDSEKENLELYDTSEINSNEELIVLLVEAVNKLSYKVEELEVKVENLEYKEYKE